MHNANRGQITGQITGQNTPRHARLFELIRQQNLAVAQCQVASETAAELNDAQSFVAAAQNSLRLAS